MRARSIDDATERAKIVALARLGMAEGDPLVAFVAARSACERLVRLEDRRSERGNVIQFHRRSGA